jgi:hypothetical protein
MCDVKKVKKQIMIMMEMIVMRREKRRRIRKSGRFERWKKCRKEN